ncbi:HIT domain-containing protein [Candidatus Pacearchaeota archaeon]|nr:HIT domain-containing protein [Candidatus Pacearchaeota archaeon]
MPLSKEESEEIKKQLLPEIDKLNDPKKEDIKKYILSLDEEGLEEFLTQNKIQFKGKTATQDEKLVFQMLVNNELPSYKIDENKEAIAILEINPFSRGHVLIIPKQKTTMEKIPKQAFSLTQKIAKKIKAKLKPDEIKVETFAFQEYAAINIIPVYKEKPLKKEKASEEELKKLHALLEIKKSPPRERKPKGEKKSNTLVLKSRSPKFY